MQGIFHRRDCMGCTRSKIAIDLTTLILELSYLSEINISILCQTIRTKKT